MQKEILEPHAKSDLRVYAVWFNMVDGDSRQRWPADLLTDRRVTHFWDEEKTVGRWFAPRMDTAEMEAARAPDSSGLGQPVLWDAYLVYGPEARWDDEPTALRRWGRTILRTQSHLRDAVTALHGKPAGTR
ncbi:MAG: hypothetical protein ABIP65_11420 [Vicinamibacterales bacterium]